MKTSRPEDGNRGWRRITLSAGIRTGGKKKKIKKKTCYPGRFPGGKWRGGDNKGKPGRDKNKGATTSV